MAEVRTFVAVDISPAVKAQIGQIIGQLRPLGSMIRWVRPEGLHLTLKFLGEISQEQLATVYQAVESGVAGISPFSFTLAEMGAFPNLRRPRVIWIGVPDSRSALVAAKSRSTGEGDLQFLTSGLKAFWQVWHSMYSPRFLT